MSMSPEEIRKLQITVRIATVNAAVPVAIAVVRAIDTGSSDGVGAAVADLTDATVLATLKELGHVE